MVLCRSSACAISFMFIAATVLLIVMGNARCESAVKNVSKAPEILAIVQTRKRIAFEGFLIGLALALIVSSRLKKTDTLNRHWNACLVATITLTVQYFYYICTPKSDWVLHHLQTRDEIDSWICGYRHMQVWYHVGALTGLGGAFFLGYM